MKFLGFPHCIFISMGKSDPIYKIKQAAILENKSGAEALFVFFDLRRLIKDLLVMQFQDKAISQLMVMSN